MTSIVFHNDFATYNTVASPSYFFAANFILNYGVGWLFTFIVALALAAGTLFWRRNRSLLVVDIICLATVFAVIGVDTFLGAALDLKPPYQNAVKYCYHALPFLALLAASLTQKSQLAIGSFSKSKLKKWGLRALYGLALFLTADALVFNMRYVNLLSGADFIIFRVQPGADVGYSFFVSNPLTASSMLMFVQVAGFAVGLSGIAWLARNRIKSSFLKLVQPKKEKKKI